MIENVQKTHAAPNTDALPSSKRTFFTLRARRLSAIEIAEGALLADIGVVFQLLVRFFPVGAPIVQLLVPVIFAVIVLRRGLYVGCMSLCVALFMICIVMGPGGAPFLLLEAGAGIFLGLTMRYRLSHFLTIALGVVGGGTCLWGVLLFYAFLAGGPRSVILNLHRTYATLAGALSLLFNLVHLGGFWQSWLFPLVDGFMQWGFQNWLLLFFLVSCATCIPLVLGVYFVTNFFLRLLGYRVRPFPGYRLEGLLYGLVLWLLNMLPRRVFARSRALHHFKCEVRRLNIARLRQHRVEKEAKQGV